MNLCSRNAYIALSKFFSKMISYSVHMFAFSWIHQANQYIVIRTNQSCVLWFNRLMLSAKRGSSKKYFPHCLWCDPRKCQLSSERNRIVLTALGFCNYYAVYFRLRNDSVPKRIVITWILRF